MNVLDIAQNSVDAGASLIQISLCIATAPKRMTLTIADNGRGMPAEFAARVTDPFCTSRTSRRGGPGAAVFKNGGRAHGRLALLESEPGKGTRVCAAFTLGHIDLAPLGICPPPCRA